MVVPIWGGTRPTGRHPGWPDRLRCLRTPAGVGSLRRVRFRDGREWSRLRLRDEAYLTPWEPVPPGRWADHNALVEWPGRWGTLRAMGRAGTALPYALTIDGRFCGQVVVGNIVREPLLSAYVGYWVSAEHAGRGAPGRPLLLPRRAAPHRGPRPPRERREPAGAPQARLPRGGAAQALPRGGRRLARPRRAGGDGRGRPPRRSRRARAAGRARLPGLIGAPSRSRHGPSTPTRASTRGRAPTRPNDVQVSTVHRVAMDGAFATLLPSLEGHRHGSRTTRRVGYGADGTRVTSVANVGQVPTGSGPRGSGPGSPVPCRGSDGVGRGHGAELTGVHPARGGVAGRSRPGGGPPAPDGAATGRGAPELAGGRPSGALRRVRRHRDHGGAAADRRRSAGHRGR